jgi:hypothetical protein
MQNGFLYAGQFRKKVALLHVCNEVTSEPTITQYTTIARKALKVCLELPRESFSGSRRQGRPCCKMATPQQKAFWIHVKVFPSFLIALYSNTFILQRMKNYEYNIGLT